MYQVGINKGISMKVMPPTLFLLNKAPGSFLPYPPDSDSVQLHHDHWCSSQSCALNTTAKKKTKYKVRELLWGSMLHNDEQTVHCGRGWKIRGNGHHLRT